MYRESKEGKREMINLILRKEIKEKINSLWFIKIFLIAIILILGSAIVQKKDYQIRMKNYSHEMLNEEIISEDLKIIFVPEKLSLFARGLDVQKGISKTMNPFASLFSPLDFLYIFNIFFSLIAILIGSMSVSKEYEQGTLRLTLSNSISRADLLTGKWLADFLSLSFISFILYLFLTLFFEIGGISFNIIENLNLFLIFLISLCYLSSFLLLGMFISVVTINSTRSTIVVLFLWITLVFIIPNAGSLIGKATVAPPKKATIDQRKYLITQEIRQRANRGEITWKDYRKLKENAERKWEDYYNNKIQEFVTFSKNIMRLSPSSSYIFSITNLTKTGVESWVKKKMILKSSKEEDNKKAISISSFMNRTTASVLPDILFLLLFNFFFFICGYVSFAKKSIHREVY